MRPMCEGKKKYFDEASASAVMQNFKVGRYDKHPSERWNAYKCPECTFWHVGHTKFAEKP